MGLFYFQKKSKLGVDILRVILIIGHMISKTYDIDEVMEQGRDFHIEARVSFCNVDGIHDRRR